MSALIIPGFGEKPGGVYRKVVSFGVSTTNDVVVAAGDNAIINITAPGVFIEGLEKQCITGFTASCALLMGDSADSDGWGTDTAMNLAASAAVFSNLAASMAYAGGKLYTDTDAILFNITGAPAAGQAKVRVTYQVGVSDTNLNVTP